MPSTLVCRAAANFPGPEVGVRKLSLFQAGFDAGETLFIISIQKDMLNSLFRAEQRIF
jgi:hypothetical protein